MLSGVVSGPAAIVRLLSRVRLAETLPEALGIRRDIAHDESVITRSGEWIGRDWLRVNRGGDPHSGVLERQVIHRMPAVTELPDIAHPPCHRKIQLPLPSRLWPRATPWPSPKYACMSKPPKASGYPTRKNPMKPRPKMAKFVLTTWAACLARQNPVSTSANPACMKMTRIVGTPRKRSV